MACNNVEVLRRAVDLDYFVSPRYTYFNLMTVIGILVKESPLEGKGQNAKHH